MRLITTDKYLQYKDAILVRYGRMVNPERTGKRGRPKKPYWEVPSGLIYAMVKKHLSKGRISKVEREIIFGTEEELKMALNAQKLAIRLTHHLSNGRTVLTEIGIHEKLGKHFHFLKNGENTKQ